MIYSNPLSPFSLILGLPSTECYVKNRIVRINT